MRYAVNWTEVLVFSRVHENLELLVNESWPLEKCDSWEYDTSFVQSSIVIDVSNQNMRLTFFKVSNLSTPTATTHQTHPTQKEIKKIMATENVSYKDALTLKKNNCITSAYTFPDIVNSQPPIPEIFKPNTDPHDVNFPSLNESHHYFNSAKPKHKTCPPYKKK